MIQQYPILLPARRRGYHLITNLVLEALGPLPETALLNLFIQHTSAALCVNENADPSVRVDFEAIVNDIIPENLPYLTHTVEGPDDMPAHVKAAFFGSDITIPITKGRLNLGTWQGIYLCEFRNRAGGRRLVATVYA
ncbi:MAG: YjbQ family protein [Bacteroidetes bacterium]|nr:MAG: YjbQ family protein [Bacteroidota bacterium]